MPRSIFVYALILVSAPAWCQEELSLDQAVALALKANRQVRAAQLEVQKAEDAIEIARTYRLPQFNFRLYELQLLNASNFLFPGGVFGVFPPIGPIPPGPTPVTIARRPASIVFAQANQPISQLHRIKLGVHLQELSRDIAKVRLNMQEQDIANQVKTSYYNLLQAQSALEATEEAAKLFRELDRVTNEGLLQQVLLRSDVLEAQNGLAKTELEMVTLRNTAATLKERINELMGRDLAVEFSVRGALAPQPWETDLVMARAKAMEQRPELREARLKQMQAQEDYRVKKAERIPDISFTVNYISPFNVDVLPKNFTGAGFAVTWDVFDWGRKRREMETKAKTIEQAGAAVDETAAQIMVDVGNRYRKLQEATQQLRVAGLARDVAVEKVRVGMNRFEQQSVLMKDVLQLQATLAEQRYKYQESLLTFWTARADLEKAIGER